MKKRTLRDKQIALTKKRHRHEMRKKWKNGPVEINKRGEHSPNRRAMFKPKRATK